MNNTPLFTLDATINKIREENLPFWELAYHGQGYNNIVALANCSVDDLELSINKLVGNVNAIPNPETVRFHICAHAVAKANGSSKLQWDFTTTGQLQNPNQNTQQNQFGGFGGFGNVDYQELKTKQQRLDDLKDTLQERKTKLQLDEFKLTTDRERFEELKKNTIEELKELEKKYNSTSDAARNGATIVLADFLKAITAKGNKGLAGLLAPVPSDPGSSEPMSPEDQEIEKIALHIQSFNLTVPEITKLFTFIDNFLKNIQKQKDDLKQKEEQKKNEQTTE